MFALLRRRQGYVADTTSVSLLALICAGMGFLAGIVFLYCMPKGRIDGSMEATRGGRRSRRSLAVPRQGRVESDGVTDSSWSARNRIYSEVGSDDEDGGGDRQALLEASRTVSDRGGNRSSSSSVDRRP